MQAKLTNNEEDTFLDRIVKNKDAKQMTIRNNVMLNDRLSKGATQYVDEEGYVRTIYKQSLAQMQKEDEFKAVRDRERKEIE